MLLLVTAACQSEQELLQGPSAEPVTAIALEPIATGLKRPVAAAHVGGDRFFVAEKDGLVRIVAAGAVLPDPLLDLRDRIATDGSERGLLGLAVHPDFASNGRFYVVYTNLDGDTEIVRFAVSAENPDYADPDSAQLILFVEQPFGNHNGGQLLFGPDGYLYIGLGDGGAVGDPFRNAQDPGTLLGAILRLDVDGGEPYTVPPDNPFVAERRARGEVWAIGLRNPWSFGFDRVTGDLYIGDVGQEGPEEINAQSAEQSGVNYGWPILEGSRCYEAERCRSRGLQPPIFEYPHSDGCAVVGGRVYRGTQFPALTGNYFFADYCLGRIWTLRTDPVTMKWQRTLVYELTSPLSNFVESADGELFVLDYGDGILYQIQAAQP
ncbi:MAG: PQQ-dependent sugar dehydrogenase [Anaerolineae bacterium]|nr:PQQ-dependent sugar dehydrogenase [Anaerolineae bacterium]MCO5196651.1 PQQ-dependent sugar dehydrogenase [Anaerolineae bacterium]MCO5207357.1 PQQ-dependent sugar dehydrogenase [Anaerolineae bacterium]